MNPDDEIAEKGTEIFRDSVVFKIYASWYILQNFPERFPLEQEIKSRIESEINVESFLFLTISAVDILYQEINNRLSLGIPDYSVNTKNLMERLAEKNDSISKLILTEFKKFTEPPNHEERRTTQEQAHKYADEFLGGDCGLLFWARFENRNGIWYEHIWNRTNSSLWELRKLRNEIIHKTILKASGDRGTIEPRDAITLHLINNAHEPYEMDFIYNPKEYFSKSTEKIFEFIQNIRKAVQQEQDL